MAININLYPPIINTYNPAFLIDSADESKNICRIYFALSSYNSEDEIKNVQVTVRNQYTNLSVLNKDKYPCDIMLTELKSDGSVLTKYKYYIELTKEDIIGGQFENNQYYKVQLRFTSVDAADQALTTPQAIDSWLVDNLNLFSEWSTVCLIRGISEPSLEITGFDIVDGKISWSLANTVIYGKLTFKDESESDSMKSYQVRLYDKDTDGLLSDSGLQYTNNFNDPNSFSYTFNYNFEPGEYYFTVEYTTMNLYQELLTFNFEVAQDAAEELDASISATADDETGRVQLTIKRSADTEPLYGTLVLRRSSSKNNFSTWEDIKYEECDGTTFIKEVWYDNTIESGVWYKYGLQLLNTTYERGAFKSTKTPVMTIFDNMFLTTKDRQLKIKFDPNVSSYKRVLQESKTDTIGSQYPFIRRNGNVNYLSLPISGLVSFEMDEEELFTSKAELFGDNLSLYTNFNKKNRITQDHDIVREKMFRDKVIEFLYDGQPKIFRSATEGNYLVRVMDASLSPNATLGRRIWTFSATAHEIGECSVENLMKYGILEGKEL